MRVLFVSLVVCTAAALSLAGQSQRAPSLVVEGQVVDAGGGAIAGAAVELTRPAVPPRTATSDAAGRFRFRNVAPGQYELTITHPRFAALTQTVMVPADATSPVALTVTMHASASTSPSARPAQRTAEGALAAPADAIREEGRAGRGGAASRALPAPPPSPASPYPPSAHSGSYKRIYPGPAPNTESYARIEDNQFHSTHDEPRSTFSTDVDTASYANVRRFLNSGTLPPADAVRVEEMINYFRFDYPRPDGLAPFSVTTDVAAAPWNPRHRLALIGLQARPVADDVDDVAARRNLVFLIDVSGSMMPEDKLPLIRKSMRLLVDTLTADDRISIVVYAGASGLVLPATAGNRKETIRHALASLEAGGSTNGGAGITLAYKIARDQFIRGGINRVILATDGDFNVGVTSEGDLVRLIEQQREAGVFLSVLGVGTGNLKDSTMEKLANKGNGNYSYLDSLHEARKVLVTEAGGTLVTVAKDVKVQVEFNPAHVSAYRLIGYENRLLRTEDFNDDRKDAGEIGAGHTVTALYEIVPAGVSLDRPAASPLRYQEPEARPAPRPTARNTELMMVSLRYKEPTGDTSRLLQFPVTNGVRATSDNVGFAAAVAEFGMLLRGSEHKGAATYRSAAALARRHRGRDESGYRAELIRLIELAESLSPSTTDDDRPQRLTTSAPTSPGFIGAASGMRSKPTSVQPDSTRRK